MKFLALLLLVASASAAGIRAGYQNDGTEVADVERQQDVLNMLYKMYEPLRERFSKLQTAANEYDPTKHTNDFTDDGKAAIELCRRYEHGELLAKKEIFSLFNDRHREQAILLFDALIFSKDWQTFISNAAYYREKVNEGVFVYAFYTAIIHSNHALNVVAPPLYEIMPHFFATSDVIHRAYEAKMKQQAGVFQLNFTGSLRNPEQHVAYFGEDIGLNVHHVTWHMDFPFWWKDGQYSHHLDRKGELFFWAHHQLNARYDAERLSNGLNFVDELDWNKPIHEGFAPHITYKYGGAFPSRADDSVFQDVDGIVTVREVETYENRIRDAIDHGYVVDREGKKVDIRGKDGIEIIGDILESSENSVNVPYYGSLHNLAHIILGRQGDPHQKYDLPPSVMEHFETATRDPAFFRLHKHLDNIFKQHKDSLPSYKSEEMEFVGVTLDNVEVDKELVTFFEEFKFDLLMAVDDTEEIDDVPMSAQTKRINHEDFSLKMTLTNNADKKVPATFRIFLMPMHDNNGVELDMNEQGWGAIELDKFWSYLTPGSNTVERKSSEASTTVPDPFSYAQIQEFASKGDLSKLERSCGIPNRFLLPKGKPEGLEFELVVVVTDAEKDGFVGKFEDEIGTTHTQCGTHGQKYPEERPLGYPFDRYIPDKEDFFAIPNMLKKTVIITHHTHHEHHH